MAGVITKKSDYDSHRVFPAHVGFTGTATANSTTNIDYKVTEASLLDKLQLVFYSLLSGDKYTVQVIDKDNVLGGGENVLVTSIFTDFNVDTLLQSQLLYESPIPILIPANTYVRIRYTSTALLGSVAVKVNLYKYKYTE